MAPNQQVNTKAHKMLPLRNCMDMQIHLHATSGDAPYAPTASTKTPDCLRAALFRITSLVVSQTVASATSSSSSAWLRVVFSLVVIFAGAPLAPPSLCQAVGYSYTRFVGPVRGPEQKVFVHDELSGGTRVDFIARPDYQFAYGVEDGQTRVLQNRKEMRNGDAVKGVYSVVDPDGTLRIVKYTADNVNGFQAEVISNGVSVLHGRNDGDGVHTNWQHQQQHHNQPQPPQDHEDDSSAGAGDGDTGHQYQVREEQNESDGEASGQAGDDENYSKEETENYAENDEDASSEEGAYEDASKEAQSHNQSEEYD